MAAESAHETVELRPVDAAISGDDLESLNWLLETADLVGPVDRLTGRITRAKQAVQHLSHRLGDHLRSSAIFDPWEENADAGIGVLNIVSTDPASLALPWELATLPNGVELGTRWVVNRVPVGARMYSARTLELPIRVVSIAPRPRGRQDVQRASTQGPVIGMAESYPDAFELVAVRPRTFDDLRRMLDELGPFDVFHFDGHGSAGELGEPTLIFEAPTRSGRGLDRISAETLLKVLGPHEPTLLLINACRSGWSATTPSFTHRLVEGLPGAQVVGMSHTVSDRTVGAVLDTFLPTLCATASVASAHAAAVASLRKRAHAMVDSRPDQIVPVLYGPPIVGALPGVQDDLPALSCDLYDWEEPLQRLDEATGTLSDRPLVVGPIFSGKSTLISLVERYHAVAGPPLGQPLRPPPLAMESRDSMTRDANVRLLQPPIAVAKRWWQGLVLSGVTEGETVIRPTAIGFETVLVCGEHLGTMKVVGDLAPTVGLRQVVEEVGFGFEGLPPGVEVETLTRALDAIDDTARELVWPAGLLGGMVWPAYLDFVRTGVEPPDAGFGPSNPTLSAIVDLCRAGLASPLFVGDLGAFWLSPLVRHALRCDARLHLDDDQFEEMRRRVVRLSARTGLEQLLEPTATSRLEMTADRGRNDDWFTLYEGLLDAGLAIAIRLGDDDLATTVASGWTGYRPVTFPTERRALAVIAHRLGYDNPSESDFPALHAYHRHLRGAAAEADERWDEILDLAARAEADAMTIAVGSLDPIVAATVREARARWRTGDAERAAELLRKARDQAGDDPTALRRIVGAEEDFRIFLGHGPRGSDREGPDWMTEMRRHEQRGDRQSAARAAARGVGDAVASGDLAGQAQALIELGRLLMMSGDPDAVRVLTEALDVQERLGRPIARILYLLACAEEAAGDLDAARSLLSEAWDASQDPGQEGNRADIVYERALVELAGLRGVDVSGPDDPRVIAITDYLREAVALYAALGRREHLAHAWLLLAQAQFGVGDFESAWTSFGKASESAAESTDPETLGMLEAVRRMLSDEPDEPRER